jgi:hypothetical protein
MSYLTNNSKNPYLTTEKDESTLLNIQEELLNNTNI